MLRYAQLYGLLPRELYQSEKNAPLTLYTRPTAQWSSCVELHVGRLGRRAVFEPMPLSGTAFETVDDADVSRFSAIAETMSDPSSTCCPAVATVLLEDLPDALPVHLYGLIENVVRMLHVVWGNE